MNQPPIILALALIMCFTLATWLEPILSSRPAAQNRAQSVLDVLLGESRRMFANHFYTKADVYFHAGHYPSIFDQNLALGEKHMEMEAAHEHEDHHDEDLPPLIRTPDDWVSRFEQYFKPSRHVHLENAANARELLPWLRISADLDPHRIETYTVAAFWLRTKVGNVDAAESFLREGWRKNPDSYEILFELGRVFLENRNDAGRARNVWLLALDKWQAQKTKGNKPDDQVYAEILINLARLEESQHHWTAALHYFTLLKPLSPQPAAIQVWIDYVSSQLSGSGQLPRPVR
jgi:tetratricopeptide (TPR) repeat protein